MGCVRNCLKLLQCYVKRTMNSHMWLAWQWNSELCVVSAWNTFLKYMFTWHCEKTFLIFIYCLTPWCTRLKILFRIWTGNSSLTVNPSSFTLLNLLLWSLCICWPAICWGWPCFTAFQQSEELRFERPPQCSVPVGM